MDLAFLPYINYLAVLVVAVIIFAFGSFWFSFLFRDMWVRELKEHHVHIKEPSREVLMQKMFITFCTNFAAAFAMAALVLLTGSMTLSTGFMLGLIASLGFAATTLGCTFTWHNKSLKLYLIDVGYPIIAITLAGMLLSIWQ